VTTHWRTEPERGSYLLLKLAASIVLTLGRRAGLLLLYPICVYFFLAAGKGRRRSARYLARALGRPATAADVFRHFHAFAMLILDRAFFITGRHDGIPFRVHGADALRDALRGGHGCILVSAHLGSFDGLRALGRDYGEMRVRPIMYEANARKVTTILRALNPELARDVVVAGKPESLVGIKEDVEHGHSLGVLADRIFSEDRRVTAEFFGAPAAFPAGPWLVAHLVGAPVFLVFALVQSDGSYDIHIEPFAPRVVIERGDRERQLQAIVARFALRLEHYCRLAPYNWFNFYDFWNEEA
jgi:predicted LPLAT superfamily acyltransferase